MPKVTVSWQRQAFPVEVDAGQLPLVFKMQLYSLTGVPPERQKIMVKGGMLKDDSDWGAVGLKEGQKLMMMGTAEKVVPGLLTCSCRPAALGYRGLPSMSMCCHCRQEKGAEAS